MNRFSALLAATLLPVAAAALDAAARPFELAVLDVGQGDASVVISPGGCAALFDGGPKGAGATIKSFLKSRGIARLDYVVTSHFHADHIGGVDEVAQGTDAVAVGTAIDRGGTYASVTFNEYQAVYGAKRVTAKAGQVFPLCGGVTLAVVAANANGISTTDENARSVAVKVTYGAFDALIGGDLETDPGNVEEAVAPAVGEIEVYKVHHHGARGASAQAMLDVLKPANAFISVGLNNTYGHPHAEAVARIRSVGAQIWQTEDTAAGLKLGHIVVTSAAGDRYDVAQGSFTKAFGAKGVDIVAPTAPVLVATSVTSRQVDLAWDGATDNEGVVDYRLEYTGDPNFFWLPLATTTATAFSDVDLPVDTDFWYRVVARDGWGNESPSSNVVQVRTVDREAPSLPAGLVARAETSTSIGLSWAASTDDVGVAGYEIVRDGELHAATAQTSYTDTVGAGESHSYTVSAYDAAGNRSDATAAASAQTGCTISIPQKSWGASTMYLYVKAVSSDPAATLTASADGALLGNMIWSDTYQSFSIRRKLAAQPRCITVTSSCGGAAVSCF